MTLYLGNNRNLARTNSLTVSNIVASQAYYRTDTAGKLGGGSVVLSGDYTGQADTVIEVEIVDNAGSTRRVSAPVFFGVGNGVLSDLAATGAVAAQNFVATLEDLGTETRFAQAPFQGATLKARASGSGGNSITVAINNSALVEAATKFALQEPLRAGVNEYLGDQWNFGAPPLSADGTLPSSAPRLRFGSDPQVYRAYRQFKNGRYVYGFSPAPVRDVEAGARVKAITGTRSITITNGVTTDTLPSIVTLYDALSAIRDDSTLVAVDGVIVNDRLPGGQGVVELSVLTVPYVASLTREGTSFVRSQDIGLTVAATAPTEQLTIQCSDVSEPGSERWKLYGQVNGELADAITGVLYNGADYQFTIPQIPPPAGVSSSSASARLELVERSDAQDVPKLCVEDMLIGARARARTYTYEWKRRPSDCECGDVDGNPSDVLLGITTEGTMPTIPPALQSSLESLYGWQSTFIANNTALLVYSTEVDVNMADGTNGVVQLEQSGTASPYMRRLERVSAVLKADRVDIEAAKAVVSIFHTALRAIFDEIGSIPSAAQTEWSAAFTALQTDFNLIGADGTNNVGADFWRKYSTYVFRDTETTLAFNPSEYGTSLLTQEFDLYLERYRARMSKVLVLGGVEPNFEDAAQTGNAVWRDYGDAYWFDSRDGLLPIQIGHYYHAARMGFDAEGRQAPVSTQEFGIGVAIGCALLPGDLLHITIDIAGVMRATYQQGDIITAQITRGEPLPMAGGQTGDDTLTWSVIGSSAGRLADYELITTAPTGYSNGGLSFEISIGGVPFVLGDHFEFVIEAARWRWRRDAGAWSAAADVQASVVLADGLNAVFSGGAAPSWVANDRWTFTAEAINGPAQLRQPTAGRCSWANSTVINLFIDGGGIVVGGLLLADHDIPSDATILAEASNDNFSTIPLSRAIAWQSSHLLDVFDNAVGYAYWRITINRSGSANWLWIGDPLRLLIAGGAHELGRLTKRTRLPSFASRAGLGVEVEHNALTQDSVDDLEALLLHACSYDRARFGVVPNSDEGIATVVSYAAESLEIDDELGFQPRDTGRRLQRVAMTLEAVP